MNARFASLTALVLLLGTSGGCSCGHKAVPQATSKWRTKASAAAAAVPRPPPPPPKAADGTYTVGGLRYVEMVTGGAKPNETLPMVIGLHGRGGTPEMFEHHFANYPGKVRFILPFGYHPGARSGFEWFPPVHNMSARELSAAVPPVVLRAGAAIAEIEKVRPTTGKPILTGFSQGAVLAYGLALLKADMFSFACPMAGELAPQIFAGLTLPPARPEVHGFHGDQDQTVAFANGQGTVNAFKRLGFTADLKVYRGVGHQFDPAAKDVISCVDNGLRQVAVARR